MSIVRRVRSRRLARLPRVGDFRRYGRELLGLHRRTAARVVFDAVFVSLTLRRRGLRPLLTEPGVRALTDPALAGRISTTVDSCFAVLPIAPTCLRRSVTLKRELSRRGLGSTMHIGVRVIDDRVEAHAWIQVGTEIINDEVQTVNTYSEIAVGELDSMLSAFP